MLKIDETLTAAGELAPVFLRLEDGGLEIVGEGGARPVPEGALEEVMAQFGAPFDPEEPVAVVASLALGDGRALRHVRHLSGFDVIARDYLLYETPGQEPVCALVRTVAAALGHLARVGTSPKP